ncbi:uncharacterized protein LAESUDRAFT_811506 [Laetiporus sulphureus 93-53]|uniref:DRBM domain-containing protein n=1 Tax=Laetiporus sulphureus 93-53 TaxID=1314785 RepID=A0A165F5B5_9APHY|nr:uncharacterized protein LAESUDRAFT_811506 [Laetiporus sulphureus 93-53]KZT08420.1 hypothetical protein LAESUDRAFT_811506 [Laetiporus sulphureus 93-53]
MSGVSNGSSMNANQRRTMKSTRRNASKLPDLPTSENSREEQLRGILRHTLITGQFYDATIYAYSRRRTSGVTDMPRPVYANSVMLQNTSDYFVHLFSPEVMESRTGLCETPSSDGSLVGNDAYDYASDSDLESEDECASGSDTANDISTKIVCMSSHDKTDMQTENRDSRNRTVSLQQDEKPGRTLFIKNIALTRLQAFVFYVFTGEVRFAPLKSQNRDANEAPQAQDSYAPLCSPKSMYRLADMCDLAELKALALEDIKAKLSQENILQELFSEFTPLHDDVLHAEITLLTENALSSNVIAEMQHWIDRATKGQPQHGNKVLTALFAKLAANNPARGGPPITREEHSVYPRACPMGHQNYITDSSDPRMNLNNWLQANMSTSVLEWEYASHGTGRAIMWTAVAFVNGFEYGRGTAASKGAAMDIAAQQALSALQARAAGR